MMKKPLILLDANIIFCHHLREIIFFYCSMGYAIPVWSEMIIDEWKYSYIKHSVKRLSEDEVRTFLEIVHYRMKHAFPYSEIKVTKEEIAEVRFKRDINDRHVIAAANKYSVDLVITNDSDMKGRKINGIEYIGSKEFIDKVILRAESPTFWISKEDKATKI